MSWFLEILTKEDDTPSELKLRDGVTTVGRADCDIELEDDKVSRHHCSFYLGNGDLTLIDQGSTNGTFVNGLRIDKKDIRHLDNIIVGSTKILAKREG